MDSQARGGQAVGGHRFPLNLDGDGKRTIDVHL